MDPRRGSWSVPSLKSKDPMRAAVIASAVEALRCLLLGDSTCPIDPRRANLEVPAPRPKDPLRPTAPAMEALRGAILGLSSCPMDPRRGSWEVPRLKSKDPLRVMDPPQEGLLLNILHDESSSLAPSVEARWRRGLRETLNPTEEDATLLASRERQLWREPRLLEVFELRNASREVLRPFDREALRPFDTSGWLGACLGSLSVPTLKSRDPRRGAVCSNSIETRRGMWLLLEKSKLTPTGVKE